MLFPVNTVLEEVFVGGKVTPKFRWGVVFGTAMIAWLVPDFGVFIGFVGSSICMVLGFILPCAFHLKAKGEEITEREKFLDWGLIVFGTVMGVMGTLESGKDLIMVMFSR